MNKIGKLVCLFFEIQNVLVEDAAAAADDPADVKPNVTTRCPSKLRALLEPDKNKKNSDSKQ